MVGGTYLLTKRDRYVWTGTYYRLDYYHAPLHVSMRMQVGIRHRKSNAARSYHGRSYCVVQERVE